MFAFFFGEYRPEDDRERPKHAGSLLHDCTLLYLTVVQLLAYRMSNYPGRCSEHE